MNDTELLIDICKREISSNLYNIEIDGIYIYNFIRRYVRERVASVYNHGSKYSLPQFSVKEYRVSVLKSLYHLIKFYIRKRRTAILLYSFSRIDVVNGQYLDKFTDPLIDFSKIKDSYIIFEQGRNGRHLTPRYHRKNIVYSDFIPWIVAHMSFPRKKMNAQYHNALLKLEESIENSFPEVDFDRNLIANNVLSSLMEVKLYTKIFKWHNVKYFIAPARDGLVNIIPAAKKCGVKVFELQHGVTYSESFTYSGYIDPLFSPDYFLSFGKLNSSKCYGTTDDKVVEIGWAFEKYLKHKIVIQNENCNVMVVSSPAISEQMVSITCSLASQNPNVVFHFRPHPNEQLDAERMERLNSFSNIRIDNNLENISVSLMRFDNVIGENSTVLYEALSMGKKVGKLHLEGLIPHYLDEEDRSFFYEITDFESFTNFIRLPLNSKPSKKIYTEFNPEAINQLLK